MNLFRRMLKAFLTPSDEYAAAMDAAHSDIQEQKRQEYLAHQEQLKSMRQKRADREIKSGIVIDPGGQCLCKRCGHTVSAVSDRCQQCYNKLDWNA